MNRPLQGGLRDESNVALRCLDLAIASKRTIQERKELENLPGRAVKSFFRTYYSDINRFLKEVPLTLDGGRTAGPGEELHLQLVPSGRGLEECRQMKINNAKRFAWVLTNLDALIAGYDEEGKRGFSESPGKSDRGELGDELPRPFSKRGSPGRKDHGLQSQLLSPTEGFDTEFVLASLAYLDGITSANVEGYIGDPWPLPPQKPEVQAALRKIMEEPQGFAIARLNYMPVGYASLWKFRLQQEQEIFHSLDVHGNIPDGMAAIGLTPGRYLGWISSVRIHPQFWRGKDPNRSPGLDPLIESLEKMLIQYADKDIYFERVFVKAHHQAVIDIIHQKFRAPSPAEPGESESVIKLTLLPWSLKDEAFSRLRERYSRLES